MSSHSPAPGTHEPTFCVGPPVGDVSQERGHTGWPSVWRLTEHHVQGPSMCSSTPFPGCVIFWRVGGLLWLSIHPSTDTRVVSTFCLP